MKILQKDGSHHTRSIQVFIKTVQFIIINGTRLLYKNGTFSTLTQKKILQDKTEVQN
jgi:hypothetical protein